MGIMHTSVLWQAGVRCVALDDDPLAQEDARAAGAEATFALRCDDLTDPVMELTGGVGFDAAFVTRGGGTALAVASRLLRRGGRLVLFQSVRGDDGFLANFNQIRARELQLMGTVSQTAHDFQIASQAVSTCPALLSRVRTRLCDATAGLRAFNLAADPAIPRVMVQFGS
jgi:threonine dehydrogenase-like Zn-dependent dehydrogenase